MRPFPEHYKEYYSIAFKLGLSFPEGRALYACSRLQNEGGGMLNGSHTDRVTKATYRMVHAREFTAQKWTWNWYTGGSIKKLQKNKRAYAHIKKHGLTMSAFRMARNWMKVFAD